jgi:hypothetical protein
LGFGRDPLGAPTGLIIGGITAISASVAAPLSVVIPIAGLAIGGLVGGWIGRHEPDSPSPTVTERKPQKLEWHTSKVVEVAQRLEQHAPEVVEGMSRDTRTSL